MPLQRTGAVMTLTPPTRVQSLCKHADLNQDPMGTNGTQRKGYLPSMPVNLYHHHMSLSSMCAKLRGRVFRGSCSGASPSSAARPSEDWTPSPPPCSPSPRRTGSSRAEYKIGQELEELRGEHNMFLDVVSCLQKDVQVQQDKVSHLVANLQEREKETEDHEIELALASESRDEMERLIDETFSIPGTDDDTESLGRLG